MNIQKRENGKYRARIYLGEINGVKKFKTMTSSDKKQLMKDASEYEFNLRYKKDIVSEITLLQGMEMYISSRENILSPSTINGYEKIKKNYFQDLMAIKLSKINSFMIQNEVNNMCKNLSPKTVQTSYGFLSSIFKTYAKEIQLDVVLPKSQRKAKVLPNSQQVNAMLDQCKGTDLELAIILASLGSLRRSEIIALTSDNVFDTYIRIDKAVVYNKFNLPVEKSTKNYQYRDIPLPPFVIDKLKRKQGKIVNYTLNGLSDRFSQLKKKCGIDCTFHALRHYYASVLHSLGVPDRYVAERGGWSDVKTLQNIYQHSMDENQSSINSITNDFFNKNFGG